MMKRYNQSKATIYGVKLIRIDRSVSVKMLRKLIKQYTKEIVTFRKRVTNMIRKGDWNLYVEFRSLHALILFLFLDLSVQRQVFIGLPSAGSQGSEDSFCSNDMLYLLEPLLFEDKNLWSLYQHRDKLPDSVVSRLITSTISIKITGLPKSYRITHLIQYIKSSVGGLLYWKSSQQQTVSTKGVFINMIDHEKAQMVLDLSKKQFISYKYVRVGFLPLEIQPAELLEPFSNQLSSIIPDLPKRTKQLEGPYKSLNKDLKKVLSCPLRDKTLFDKKNIVLGFWSKKYDSNLKLLEEKKEYQEKKRRKKYDMKPLNMNKLHKENSGNFGQEDLAVIDNEINESNMEAYELPGGVLYNPEYDQEGDSMENDQVSGIENNFKFNKL